MLIFKAHYTLKHYGCNTVSVYIYKQLTGITTGKKKWLPLLEMPHPNVVFKHKSTNKN